MSITCKIRSFMASSLLSHMDVWPHTTQNNLTKSFYSLHATNVGSVLIINSPDFSISYQETSWLWLVRRPLSCSSLTSVTPGINFSEVTAVPHVEWALRGQEGQSSNISKKHTSFSMLPPCTLSFFLWPAHQASRKQASITVVPHSHVSFPQSTCVYLS